MPASFTSEAASSVREGTLVAGKYRVGKVLGSGGMGVVLAAAHETLGTPVALKVLRPEAVLSPGLVGRFLQEARAAALLMSEHVAKVHDFGTLDDGSPYLAMEYLHGRDLAYVLDKRKRLSVPEAVEILRQTCDAVAEAHSAGIVHRDLKPHNLFLLARPNHAIFVKVLDFGIAKILGSERFQINVTTQSTAMLGTPLYMAPEQLRAAKTADGRSDIWSLGVIFHELLSGRVPFLADTLPELSVLVMTTDAPLLDAEALKLPEELVAIVAKCLKRDPAERFSSVEELAMALEPFVSTRRVSIADLSSPAIDAITTGPRRALATQDSAFPNSVVLANGWPASAAAPFSVRVSPTPRPAPSDVDASLATANTLPTGSERLRETEKKSGTRARLLIGLTGAGVLVGGALVFLFVPSSPRGAPVAPVAMSVTSATAPIPSSVSSAGAASSTGEWAPVPKASASVVTESPPSRHRPGERGERAPKASAEPATVAAPKASVATPKVGPNGAPIISD